MERKRGRKRLDDGEKLRGEEDGEKRKKRKKGEKVKDD